MNVNKLLIVGLIIVIGAIVFLTTKIGSKTNIKQSTTLANSVSAAVGSVAPDFVLTTLEKETFRLNDKKGKTVIVFGVAGWCGECIPEGKALTQIKKDYTSKGVEIIGVAFTKGDNNELLKQYKQVGGVDIPLALDTSRWQVPNEAT